MGLDMYLTAQRARHEEDAQPDDDYIPGWVFAEPDELKQFERVAKMYDFEGLIDQGSPWAYLRGEEVGFCVGYWRKANAVHRWFVENVQDGEDECNPFAVTREQLADLRECCRQVIDATDLVPGMVYAGSTASPETMAEAEAGEMPESRMGPGWIDSHELGHVIPEDRIYIAEDVMPTTSGFFFGSTDYDHWYVEDLRATVAIVDKCLAMDETWSFTYRSSW